MATTKTTTTTTTKKPKIPPLSQLCWNCKRAVNSKDFKCPWADKGVPIKGWTAAPNIVKQSGRKPISSYYITGCPLYIEDKPWGCDFTSVYNWLGKEFGHCRAYIRAHYMEFLAKYERKHNTNLPLWMFEDIPTKPRKRKNYKETVADGERNETEEPAL